MNEIKTVEELDKLGVKICEMLQVGIDKADVVIPDTLQQILRCELLNTSFELGIAIFLFIFSGLIARYCIYHLYKETFRNNSNAHEIILPAGMISGVTIFIVSFAALVFNVIPSFIKILTAPNLVIIEKLSRL